MLPMTARHVFYTGRVQGVGFRYAVRQVASGYEVSGWVRNLTDGRVELLAASHDPEELSAFLHDIRETSGVSSGIKLVEEETVPAPPGLSGFLIRKD